MGGFIFTLNLIMLPLLQPTPTPIYHRKSNSASLYEQMWDKRLH